MCELGIGGWQCEISMCKLLRYNFGKMSHKDCDFRVKISCLKNCYSISHLVNVKIRVHKKLYIHIGFSREGDFISCLHWRDDIWGRSRARSARERPQISSRKCRHDMKFPLREKPIWFIIQISAYLHRVLVISLMYVHGM